MVVDLRLLAGSGTLPPDILDDDNYMDCDLCPPDPNDNADFGHGGCAPAAQGPLDPLSSYIQELEVLSSMNCPDFSSAVDDLPLPQEGGVP
jgi:hypothetical protein